MKERAKFLYLIIFEQAVVKTTPISLYIWDLPFRVKRRVMNGPLYKTNPNSNIVWPFPTKCGAKEPGNSGHKATDLVTCEINYPAVQMRAILPRFSKSRSTISKSPQWTKCRLEKVPILLRTERLLFELAAVATAATFSLLQILQHLLSAGHWGSLFKVLASEVPQVPEDFCVSPVLPTQPLTTSRCLDSLDESHHFLYSHSPQRLIRRSSLYRISPVALIPRHDIVRVMVLNEKMEPPVAPVQPSTISQSDINQRFYRHFQAECTELQEQIAQLENYSLVGGEKQDAIDHVNSGITRLSDEVSDASGFVPAYDQRVYSQVIPHYSDIYFHSLTLLLGNQSFTREASRCSNQICSQA